MMAKRLLTALVAALVISGTFTLWLSKKFAHPAQAAVEPTLKYVAPSKPLEAGATVAIEDLKFVDWPSKAPLDGAFTKMDQVVGRTLMFPATAGEPLNEHVLEAGAGGLTAHIPAGMRAISLKSDEVVGVAGFTLPGTHVDVLVSYRMGNSPDQVTSTVLQDVEVLTAGQQIQPDPQGKATQADVVTLLVSPEDAQRVVLASAQGTVHFVLRNGGDHGHMTGDSTLTAFGAAPAERKSFTLPPPPAKERPFEPSGYAVQTVNGDKQTVERF